MQNIQTLKGFRDFLPHEAKKRLYVIDILKKVFMSYGFEPLETPVLEYEELLMGKYGDEGDKLMYRFTDNGDRRVAMRYDQTVPLARVVAQYQNELQLPFKRYQIQPVWRAENTQKGRYREFLQCDIDTVGSTSSLADAEVISLVAKSYEALGFRDFTILINDRTNFNGIPLPAIMAIDKLKKIGPEKVKEELVKLNLPSSLLDKITNKLPTNSLKQIMLYAKKLGVAEKYLRYEPTLARGLDYYTGLILEVEIAGYRVGSVGGGGRYDNLIGLFAQKPIPAVGYAFGFDRIIDAMTEQQLFPNTILSSATRVLVTIFNQNLLQESLTLLLQLRDSNIAAELFLQETQTLEKQLRYANQKQIPYVMIVGEDEVAKGVVSLRDMTTREQKEMTFTEALALLR